MKVFLALSSCSHFILHQNSWVLAVHTLQLLMKLYICMGIPIYPIHNDSVVGTHSKACAPKVSGQMRAVVVTVKCGAVVGPYQNRRMYSAFPWESHQHTGYHMSKSSKVFVGVPHQLAAYTATTDKSVLG